MRSTELASTTAPEPALGERALWLWNRFWFERVPSHSLSLLRLFLGITLLMRQTALYGLYRIHDLRAELPRYEYSADSMPDPHFAMPWRFLEWVPAPSLWTYRRIDEVVLVLALMFTAGWLTRVVTPLIAVLFAYVLAASQANYYHHFWVFTIAFTVLAFSHCGDHYSLDSYLRGPQAARPERSILPLRLLQVLVSTIYSFTFLAKLNHGWLSGDIIRIFDDSDSIVGPFRSLMLGTLGAQGLSLLTLAGEGFLAFALWVPRLRRTAIGVGIVLHLGIDMLMMVRTFSFQMMALYIVFVAPASGGAVALVDGRCALCRRMQRLGMLFDWLRRVTWRDFRDPSVRARIPDLPPERLEREMAVVTPDGRVHWGFFAWRELAIRFPLTLFPGSLLFLPGVAWLGRKLYARIARKRYDSGCGQAGAACSLSTACGLGRSEESDRAWQETLRALHVH